MQRMIPPAEQQAGMASDARPHQMRQDLASHPGGGAAQHALQLTPDDMERFRADGAVCLRNCIPPVWVDALRRAAAELEASPGPSAEHVPGATSEYFTDLEMACRLRCFEDFARHGPCAGIAGTLMESEQVCFLYDQYFQQVWRRAEGETGGKGAQGPRDAHTPWHQDQPYWHVSGSQVVTVWMPLDDSPADANVQYIAGSHRWCEHSPFHFATGKQYAGTGQKALPDIEAGLRDGSLRSLQWDTRPGDAIVFSAMTVHGQSPLHGGGSYLRAGEQTRRFRRVAFRFTGDDARYMVRDGEARDVIPSKTFPCTLSPGDKMECARFPQVWTRQGGLVG
jgi:hypothetical protein